MEKAISTKVQAMTVKVQAITTQPNRKIAPYPHQQVTTMASCLRDFTRMNPPIFYWSNEYPQEFIDEVYMILYAMAVS